MRDSAPAENRGAGEAETPAVVCSKVAGAIKEGAGELLAETVKFSSPA